MTAAQARLTPHNAVTEIDRLILTTWREKLPVSMELPSDIAYLDVEVPAAPLELAGPPSDPERLRSCTAAIAEHLSHATSPAILVDQDADRFGAATEVMRRSPREVAASSGSFVHIDGIGGAGEPETERFRAPDPGW